MICIQRHYIRVRNDLILAVVALLVSAAIYIDLSALAAPASFTLMTQSGTVDSNPAMQQIYNEIEQEQQQLVGIRDWLPIANNK